MPSSPGRRAGIGQANMKLTNSEEQRFSLLGDPARFSPESMRIFRTALLCCITATTALSQRGPAPFYEDTNNIPVSPEVHSDRRVTFRLFAPKASEVVLMGSPGILEVIKKPMPLAKDDKGVWSLTIGPIPPGFYSYGYAIDGGLRMPDPSNPNLEVRRWGPTSEFIVPGGERGFIEERRAPHWARAGGFCAPTGPATWPIGKVDTSTGSGPRWKK